MSDSNLTRIKITSYKPVTKQYTDPFDGKLKNREYTVPLNPSSIDRKFEFESQDTQGSNSTEKKRIVKYVGETLSFELLYDGTGALGNQHKGSVSGMVKELLNTLFVQAFDDAHQDTRDPAYLIISYLDEGNESSWFRCRVQNVDIKYTLFNKKGNPLRAKVSLSFKSTGKIAEPDEPKQDKPAQQKDPKPKPKPKPKPTNDNCLNKQQACQEINGDVNLYCYYCCDNRYNTIHPTATSEPLMSQEPNMSTMQGG